MYNYVYKGKNYFKTHSHNDVILYMYSDRGLVVRNKSVLMTGTYSDAKSYFKRTKNPAN